MATKFNQIVPMDLKRWAGEYILNLIDMWLRLTVSVFLKHKKPCEVIDKILMHWVGAGYGLMGAILSDNGEEFSSDESKEVASVLNMILLTTAAESPFQNGLCEREHSITDNMLTKLIKDCPNIAQIPLKSCC